MEEHSMCKTWEEDMYWKHFTSMHFFLTLPPDFHDQLVLPQKFTAHIKAELPDKVSLKGPCGVLWDIEVLKSNDLLFVGDGWKDFVKVNELKENCVLVFKFKRNSGFEVLIFDHVSSCEKESAYFVKKCRHTKPGHEDLKKKNARDTSTEVIENVSEENIVVGVSKKSKNDDEAVACSEQSERKVSSQAPRKRAEDSAFIISKKSKKDNEAMVCSEGKVSTQAPKKLAEDSAFVILKKSKKHNEMVVCSGGKVSTQASRKHALGAGRGKKSIKKESTKEVSQIPQRDVITPENEENFPEKDQYKKTLNEDEAAMELRQISRRELITPESSESSPAGDHSHKLKGQCEEQPSRNHIANEPRLVSKMIFVTTGNGESFKTIDQSPELKPQSEKRPRSNGTSKNLSQIFRKEIITPENGEKSPITDCSQGFKGQAEKELSGRRGIVKRLSQISVREVVRPYYRESSSEEDHYQKSSGKRGRPKTQVLPKSSKKLVFKCDGRRISKEYISNRRPVTDKEKEDALQRANQKLTEKSFLALMRPTSVYNRFFLSVPAKWMQKHLPSRNQEVVLRVGEKRWHTTLLIYGNSGGRISTGWKKFSLDNFLEEFDVLVFNPVNLKDDASHADVVIDVEIFRVAQEITPLIPLLDS